MSYQRWTQGDAYVIGIGDYTAPEMFGGAYVEPAFDCCACSVHKTYREIITHLETEHTDSEKALERLRAEAAIAGLDNSWPEFLRIHPDNKLPVPE